MFHVFFFFPEPLPCHEHAVVDSPWCSRWDRTPQGSAAFVSLRPAELAELVPSESASLQAELEQLQKEQEQSTRRLLEIEAESCASWEVVRTIIRKETGHYTCQQRTEETCWMVLVEVFWNVLEVCSEHRKV